MKNKKTLTLTLIGLFIFLFSIVGLTYAYWSRTLTQTGENLVYTDCLKLEVNWGTEGFTLNDAYPMTNKELVSDFFPKQTPYHFTITNTCESEVPISINMESLTPTEAPVLKDEYVDVILWEGELTDKMTQGTTKVLSYESPEEESKYRLIDNTENKNKIIDDAKKAYELYKFKLQGGEEKSFNLLLFMDYATPVSTEENPTNNAHWVGKITLNNYELPKVKIGGIEVQTIEEGDGLYVVEHVKNEQNAIEEGFYNTEYRYAGVDPDNYIWFNCQEGQTSGEDVCEKWRIIGLVNVKAKQQDGSYKVEQRLKIIKNEPLKGSDDKEFNVDFFYWDHKLTGVGSSISDTGSNDWTDSELMQMLNDIYYNGTSGPCYIGGEVDGESTCDFTQNGLKDSAKKMIDEKISWNIGGWDTAEVSALKMYEYERGTTVFENEAVSLPWPRPTEWNKENTRTPGQTVTEKSPELFHSIGLLYPSDFGLAVGGTVTERNECINNTNLNLYYSTISKCDEKDWLVSKLDTDWAGSSEVEWTMTPSSWIFCYVFYINGYVDHINITDISHLVRPVVYLSPSVKITKGTGDINFPYELSIE